MCPSNSPNPYVALTPEDRARILSYGDLMLHSVAGRGPALEPGLLTDLLQVTLHGTSFSRKTALQVSSLLEQRSRAGLALLPEFQALPATAQLMVMQHNLPLVHRFRQALCLASPALSWRKLVEIFVGEERLRSCEENLPHDLSGKASPTRPLEYEDLLSSASCNGRPDLQQEHLDLAKQLADSVDPEDKVQIILTALIIVFCPDFLDLRERSAVEQTQMKFVLLLQSYLSSSCPTVGAARLARTLMVPAIARQIHGLARERLFI